MLTGGETVSVNTNLIRALGRWEDAVLVQYLSRWSSAAHDGWAFRTEAQIEADTTIPAYTQKRIRARLRGLGLLDEEKRGMPSRMFYRVDAAALFRYLADKGQSLVDTPSDQETLQLVTTSGNNEQPQYKEFTVQGTSQGTTAPNGARARTRIPKDWNLTDEDVQYAKDLGFYDRDIDEMAEQMFLHFDSTGKVMANWTSTWQAWCRREIKMAKNGRR